MSEPDVTYLPRCPEANEDRRLQAGHLWVFSNEVDTQQTPLNKLNRATRPCAGAHDALWTRLRHPSSLITARLLELGYS